MNKPGIYLVAGAVMIVAGVSLLSLNSYMSITDNCSQLYPNTMVNGTYTTPPAYNTCENALQALSTPLMSFGILLAVIGFIAVVGGMSVDLTTAYKERQGQ